MKSVLLSTLCIFLFSVNVNAESVHWQWRELICKGTENQGEEDATPCVIQLKENENDTEPRTVPFDTCTEEEVNGKVRSYCNIVCPTAATAYRITRYPQNHKSCFSHITYRLERRDDQFYMWREGKCRTSDIRFTVRCEFSSARADFKDDDSLFDETKKLLAKS
ncbi:unnamed protein product [Auanema sp. JU1783]|nr:unnamed protein product [Auanema sp. JU1783]